MTEIETTSRHMLDLSTAVEHIPQGLAMFDAGWRLVASNVRYRQLQDLPASLVAIGTPLLDIIRFLAERGDLGSGDIDAIAALRLKAITERPTTLSQRVGAAGQQLEVFSSRIPEGGLVITVSDVTARAEAEAELERVNQNLEARVQERTAALSRVNAELESAKAKADAANLDKTRFLAAASHDLLQPLNAARLYTSTLVDRAAGSQLANLAHSIDASLNAVEDIMSAILDISRIDSGALRPSVSTFNIRDLLKKVAVEFRPMAQEKNIRLNIISASFAVTTDRMLLARVLQNLVSNAIKYTRPNGKVLVGCRRRGRRLRIDTIDTGIGINKDQQSLIFTEFARLEQGARIAPGLGLGLSIVQRIAHALELPLEVESVVERGSRFSLFVPLALGERAIHAIEEKSARPPDTGLVGLKVLCIDNEADILDAMTGLIGGWGCEVRIALSLKQISARGTLEGWLPDIVLVDYHLDQTSGLDAIQWLRQNVGGHLPAALVTADRDPRVRALAADRDVAVVTKPVKPAALRAVISSLGKAANGD